MRVYRAWDNESFPGFILPQDRIDLDAFTSLMAAGDFDDDGDTDLILPRSSTARIYRNNGDGTFSAPVNTVGITGARDIEVADISGDGLPDYVMSFGNDTGGVALFTNQGGLNFTQELFSGPELGLGSIGKLAVGDMNGDGRSDVVVTRSGANGDVDSLLIFYREILGGLGTPSVFEIDYAPSDVALVATRRLDAGLALRPSLAVGDVDGDGDADAFAAGDGDAIRALRNISGECPADWNADCIVNAADVGSFLTDYFQDVANGTFNADYDNNGVTNSADVGAYLSAYFPQLSDPACTGG